MNWGPIYKQPEIGNVIAVLRQRAWKQRYTAATAVAAANAIDTVTKVQQQNSALQADTAASS